MCAAMWLTIENEIDRNGMKIFPIMKRQMMKVYGEVFLEMGFLFQLQFHQLRRKLRPFGACVSQEDRKKYGAAV